MPSRRTEQDQPWGWETNTRGGRPAAVPRDGHAGYGDYGTREYRPRPEGSEQSQRGRGPRNDARSDECIRELICERLTDDPCVDASEVTVEVKDGAVTLSGNVSDASKKHRIEEIADDCARGKDIHNHLRVAR